jgi:hypothetical protein
MEAKEKRREEQAKLYNTCGSGAVEVGREAKQIRQKNKHLNIKY